MYGYVSEKLVDGLGCECVDLFLRVLAVRVECANAFFLFHQKVQKKGFEFVCRNKLDFAFLAKTFTFSEHDLFFHKVKIQINVATLLTHNGFCATLLDLSQESLINEFVVVVFLGQFNRNTFISSLEFSHFKVKHKSDFQVFDLRSLNNLFESRFNVETWVKFLARLRESFQNNFFQVCQLYIFRVEIATVDNRFIELIVVEDGESVVCFAVGFLSECNLVHGGVIVVVS